MPDPSPAWSRKDTALAGAVVAVALVPRVAVRGQGLLDLDSALLALGVRSFDFAAYHPHPPYYALSVAAAKLLAPWLGEAQAFVWISLASLAVLAAAVYGLGRAMGGRLVGVHAGLLVALSPLVTENAGVSLTYTNEVAATAVVALLAVRARDRRATRAWLALGLAASVAVGLRPSAAITAGPLLLWAAWDDLRGLLRACAAGAAGTAAWLVPSLVAGGGWRDFRFGVDYQTQVYVLHDPVWRGGAAAASNNLAWLAHHARAELAWMACAGLLAAVAALPLWWRRGRPRGLLLAWGAPPLLFYGLVYGGWPVFHSGYALGILPPAFVAGALAIRHLHAVAAAAERPLRLAFTVLLAAVMALPLAWAPAWGDAVEARKDAQAWAASWDGLEDVLPPDRTALLGSYAAHWALVDHPGYLTWVLEPAVDGSGKVRKQVQQVDGGVPDKAHFDNVRDGPHDAPHAIPDWVVDIVVVTGHPNEASLTGPWAASREVRLPGGAVVVVLEARAFETIEQALPRYDEPVPPPAHRIWPPR